MAKKQSKPSHTVQQKISCFLIYLLPIVLYFSYYPIISIGSTESMNLEFSLPLIWLAVFALISLPKIIDIWRRFGWKKLALISLFPIYATISIFWSANTLRAILTAGILWLVVFDVLAIIVNFRDKKLWSKQAKIKLVKYYFIATALVCICCWLQCVLDLAGVNRAGSLMCAGCTYSSFGFPHPNGFAIEPQFMGNLLILPTILALYFLVVKYKKLSRKSLVWLTIFACLFSATLFLTFSRGAIYAYGIALIILIIFAIMTHHFKASLILVPVITFLFVLTVQGVFAQVSATSDTFLTGVTKAVHQLSLGTIDLRSLAFGPKNEEKITSVIIEEDEKNNVEESHFDGYAETSTDVRVGLTDAALKRWSKDLPTAIFGVGLGGAGTVIYENFPEVYNSSKEIVQNEYASILLELGVTGTILAALLILVAASPLLKLEIFAKGLFLALILAYASTLFFFSGFPNALHIYLLLPLFGILFLTKDNFLVEEEV